MRGDECFAFFDAIDICHVVGVGFATVLSCLLNDGLSRLQAGVDDGLRVEGDVFRTGFSFMLDALDAQDCGAVIFFDAGAVVFAECDAFGIED